MTPDQAAWIANVTGYHRHWSQEKIRMYRDVLRGRISPKRALEWLAAQQ